MAGGIGLLFYLRWAVQKRRMAKKEIDQMLHEHESEDSVSHEKDMVEMPDQPKYFKKGLNPPHSENPLENK